MGEVATIDNRQVATAKDMHSHVQRIQQVMAAVMKDGVHHGKIPGTDKPTLLKPGAEVLCLTFHIAPSYVVDDLSGPDVVRYRVRCTGTHQGTGLVMGEGLGEASSNEEKYRWRRAANQREFDAADLDRKRIKYGSKWSRDSRQREDFEIQQVRVEPADVANTILKMACKRALIAMTLNVTAASDIFSQDLEDMPEGMDLEESATTKPKTQAPKAKAGGGNGLATEKQVGFLRRKLEEGQIAETEFLAHFEVDTVEALPFAKVNEALKWIAENTFGG